MAAIMIVLRMKIKVFFMLGPPLNSRVMITDAQHLRGEKRYNQVINYITRGMFL
jgi:hypothetical protein